MDQSIKHWTNYKWLPWGFMHCPWSHTCGGWHGGLPIPHWHFPLWHTPWGKQSSSWSHSKRFLKIRNPMILNTCQMLYLIDRIIISCRIDIFTWSTRPKIAANLFLWISIPDCFWSCTTTGKKYMFNQIGLMYFCG